MRVMREEGDVVGGGYDLLFFEILVSWFEFGFRFGFGFWRGEGR